MAKGHLQGTWIEWELNRRSRLNLAETLVPELRMILNYAEVYDFLCPGTKSRWHLLEVCVLIPTLGRTVAFISRKPLASPGKR